MAAPVRDVAFLGLGFRDAAHAFLEPAMKRRNLTIVTHTEVDRIIFEGRRAVGVKARRDGQPLEYRCKGEVIVCAGAIQSPKLLQLSGIGPGERLLQSQTAGLVWKPDFAFGNAFALARARLPRTDRIAAYERYVSDPPDGAAPRAIAEALARLKRGDLLSRSSTEYLLATMESSHTGKQRLRGAVPAGWTFGHKTGTGQDLAGRTAGYNDVGLLIAPDGRSYAIAVMIGDTPKPIPARQALMQAVVASVVAQLPRR
jgi:beta-lactamase class A